MLDVATAGASGTICSQSYPQPRRVGGWLASAIITTLCDCLKKEIFVLTLLQDAGWPIWPLLLCSILVLAMVIERLIALQQHKIMPSGLLEQAIKVTRQAPAQDAWLEEQQGSGALGPVLASGIRTLKDNPLATDEEVRSAMEIAGRTVIQHMERYLGALGTLASAAPLLGLLGTVIGMIDIFGAQQGGANSTAQLAHGISVALYNTAFGLMVAIPALIFWRYFRARVDAYLLRMEVASAQFLHHLLGLRR